MFSFTLNPIETDTIQRSIDRGGSRPKAWLLERTSWRDPSGKHGAEKDPEQVSNDSGKYQDQDRGLKSVSLLFSNQHFLFSTFFSKNESAGPRSSRGGS